MYGSLADADAYHDARGRADVWSSRSVDDRLAALIRAADYVDAVYESRFAGQRTDPEQDRAWPRRDAGVLYGAPISPDAVPRPVEIAAYEVALREIMSPGSLLVAASIGAAIQSESIDGAVSVTYRAARSVDDYVVRVLAAERVLAPLLAPAGGLSGTAVRA